MKFIFKSYFDYLFSVLDKNVLLVQDRNCKVLMNVQICFLFLIFLVVKTIVYFKNNLKEG